MWQAGRKSVCVKPDGFVLESLRFNTSPGQRLRQNFVARINAKACRTRELSAEQKLLVPVSSADIAEFYAACNLFSRIKHV